MLIAKNENQIVGKEKLSIGILRFHEKRNRQLENCKSFRELSELFESKEEFVDESRVAVSLNLMYQGLKVGIIRDDTIYLGNESDIEVNLNIIDAIIASRVYIPGGDYGILGKIDSLRNNTSLYYDKKIQIEMEYWKYAYEHNLDTNEECYMSRGTLEIFDKDLAKIILNDKKVKVLSAKM